MSGAFLGLLVLDRQNHLSLPPDSQGLRCLRPPPRPRGQSSPGPQSRSRPPGICPSPIRTWGPCTRLAYRCLDYPEICEVGKHFKAFNETVSTSFQLSAPSRNDVDDGYAASEGAAEGDKLLRDLQRRRALMQPQALWPEELKGFARAWQSYKTETGTMDFTDLIEVALRDVNHPPGAPDIGFLDEAQDLTPCEMALWRKWAAGMDKIIICGDPDQAIFSFKGARAAEMLTPIPEENVRVLKQSYRVPVAVHEVAQNWIEKIPPTHRKQVEYLPRDYPGEVRRTDHHYKDPGPLIDMVQPYLEAGKSVLFLASVFVYALPPPGRPASSRPALQQPLPEEEIRLESSLQAGGQVHRRLPGRGLHEQPDLLGPALDR